MSDAPGGRAGPALRHEVHGDHGPFLLLVHGFLSGRAQWLPNIDALSEIARPVVVELFGHGRSPSPEDPTCYSPEHYVEEFERVRDALGADRWFVIGQSLGAALTLRYALDHPERVIAQVFTNSTSALAEEGWAAQVRPVMEAQALRLIAHGRAVLDEHPLNPARGTRMPPDVRGAFRADSALLDALGVATTGLYTVPGSSVRSRVGENRVPTLLVVGEREERFKPHRRYAEAHMPLLEIVGLDGGHAVNIDAAAEFNRAVVSFFRRHLDGKDADDTPQVLFVCVHNAGRSQMAAALMAQLAGGRVHARSAGSTPAAEINPAVVEAMREVGVDLSDAFPKPLADEFVQAADVIVTMGCGDACPVYPGKRYVDWDVPDPAGKPIEAVRAIREDIRQRVEVLLAELSSGQA